MEPVQVTFENWAVYRMGDVMIWSETISFTRKDAIKKFLSNTSITWKEARKNGYRCLKFSITAKALPCGDAFK